MLFAEARQDAIGASAKRTLTSRACRTRFMSTRVRPAYLARGAQALTSRFVPMATPVRQRGAGRPRAVCYGPGRARRAVQGAEVVAGGVTVSRRQSHRNWASRIGN